MKRTLFVSSIVLSVAVLACFIWIGILMIRSSKPVASKGDKPYILVSIDPYAEMVRQIGGDTVDVSTIIPAHVDPHNWEASYSDMEKLRGANLWLSTGMGFEGPLQKKLLQVDSSLVILDLNESVHTLSSCCGHNHNHAHYEEIDTHTWLSPKIDVVQAHHIADVLSKLQPQYREFYHENYLKLEKRLVDLDASIAETLAPFHGGTIVSTHGAYGYFCFEYHLEQLVIEPSEGKEPRLREITELVKKINEKKENILAIFTQPQHTNKATKLLARELGMKTYSVDPYAPDYIATMEQLTKIISSSKVQGEGK